MTENRFWAVGRQCVGECCTDALSYEYADELIQCSSSTHACPVSTSISRYGVLRRLTLALGGVVLLVGCEAPLVLSGVEQQKQATTLRFDQFQAVSAIGDEVVVVGSKGAVLSSHDGGLSWQRQVLDAEPSLIAVDACGEDGFAALDINRSVWTRGVEQARWTAHPLDTPETPLSLDCTADGQLWVVGSFSTFWSSTDSGQSWKEVSLNEDLMLTAVQFLDADHGYALGEFGTVLRTTDGGEQWQMMTPLPNEFYPLSVLFVSAQEGWVSGLNGGILATHDGGTTWQRAETPVDAPLYGLAAGEGVLYATGDHGSLIVSHDGHTWQRATAQPKTLSYLRGITALSSGDVIVAGGGGVLARIDPDSQQAALGGAIGVTP